LISREKNQSSLYIALVLFFVCFISARADAICKGSIHNPITEVCWHCMFPFKIAGVTIVGSPTDTPDAPDPTKMPICICPISVPPFFRIGISISFWEPARFIEVVKDAYCFPSIGVGFSSPKHGFLNGGSEDAGDQQEMPSTFYQAHYAIYPVWTLLELFMDSVCLEHSGFDIAYLTELDPTWNDDLMAVMIYPETLLFGNMPAQLSCTADSVGSNGKHPISQLFWCMGSSGSTYPMSGHVNDDKLVQSSLSAASRLVYKMGRFGALCDTGVDICKCTPTPIWVKRNYRFSLAKPITGHQCVPVGRSELIWGAGKNPPLPSGGDAPDNFMYILFRKRACCVF